jgi:hypothetical protein
LFGIAPTAQGAYRSGDFEGMGRAALRPAMTKSSLHFCHLNQSRGLWHVLQRPQLAQQRIDPYCRQKFDRNFSSISASVIGFFG